MEFLKTLFSSRAFKAWTGAVAAAAASIATGLSDGALDGTEVGYAIGAFLGALGFVYTVKNKRDGEPQT